MSGRLGQFEEALGEVCERLLKADPDIRAVVQFGSSVYAPDLADDVDLLVLSEAPKPIGVYLMAVEGAPVPVHVVPARAGRKLEPFLAASVRAWGRVIAGDPEVVREAVEGVPLPSLREVEEALSVAEASLDVARRGLALGEHYHLVRTGLHSLSEAVKKGALIALCSNVRGPRAKRALLARLVELLRHLQPMVRCHCSPDEGRMGLERLVPAARDFVEWLKSEWLEGGSERGRDESDGGR